MKQIVFSFLLVFGISLVGCKENPKGEEAKVSDATTPAASGVPIGDAYAVDPAKSSIAWEGSKVGGKHMGTINVSSGEFFIDNGNITGGSFTIDMNSIVVTDIKAGEGKEDLESHLKGTASEGKDDFFNVESFPIATFAVTKSEPISGDANATHAVTGNLNLKGGARSITIKAKVAAQGDAVTVVSAPFTINRTDWGIKYGSASFFDNLADKAINDNIGLTINVAAAKKAAM
jgi:polyisoprenoid-binding protein YceI